MYRIISWVAVILWAVLIFSLSHQPVAKSSELSSGITKVIVERIEDIAPHKEFNTGSLHHIVRKNAHFFIYFALGFLMMNALRESGLDDYRTIGLSLIVCVLYAASDEVHQMFVSGRGAQVKDVLIDSTGSAVGVSLYLFISRAMKSRSTRIVIKD